MNSAELRRYYPLNLLGPMGLDELCAGAKIQTYEDGDYIYRVWDESEDLLYVIDGKVQMLESGKPEQIIMTHEDKEALRPFTHAVSKVEAAIAKNNVKVLKVDFELFSSLLARDSGKDIASKIKKNTAAAGKSSVKKSNEVEPLDLPDFDDLDIELKPVNTTPPDFSRRKAMNRDPVKPEVTKKASPKSTSKPLPIVSEYIHAEPDEARPVARPARFTRSGAKPEAVTSSIPKEEVVAKASDKVSAQAVPPKARVKKSVESVVKADIRQPDKVEPKADTEKAVEPVVETEEIKIEAYSDQGPVEKIISRVKKELTEERHFDLKLVKSAESPEKPKPTKLKVEKGLFDKLKDELTAERKLDLKLVKSAPKVEPEPEPVNQLSEIDQYLNAMVLYREEKWAEAHAAFLALTIDHPATNLYMVYASKCSELISDESLRTG